MRLVVMMPALNEEQSVGQVIQAIPREITGIDKVEALLVDDGSTDATVEVARKAGCDHILSLRQTRGVAKAFKAGLEAALALKADIIVNIDADNQFDAGEVPKLTQPILDGKADVVLGSRFKGRIESMSARKRIGNRIGTFVTKVISRIPLSDAQSGYRAFSREAAMRINVLSHYTYTQETIVQAAYKRLKVVEVPVTCRRRTSGESRLIAGLLGYIGNAGVTMIRTFMNYQALKVLAFSGAFLMLGGLAFAARVLIHFFTAGMVSPYIPSAIAAGFLMVFGFQLILLGLVADMVRSNRELVEDALYLLRKEETETEGP